MLQSHQVLSFLRPQRIVGDWSQQELAEFYRVEAALISSGISVCTDRGLSDEGDPWFVFCRQDNDDVIVHFARIDGDYVIVSNLMDGVVRGRDFNSLVRELLHNHPYILPKATQRRQTVFLHPAALLAALVVTGYLKSAEISDGPDDPGRNNDKTSSALFGGHSLVALSALAIAAVWDVLVADPLHKLIDFALLDDASAAVDNAGHSAPQLHDDSASLDLHALAHASVVDVESSSAALSAHDSDQSPPVGKVAVAAQVQSEHVDTTHSQDGGLPVSLNLDVSRLERDGSELTQSANGMQGKQGDTYSSDAAASVKTTSGQASLGNSHGSSSSLGASTSAAPASDAVTTVYGALNLDPQSIHPVALSATTLADAVHFTLSELNLTTASVSTSEGLVLATSETLAEPSKAVDLASQSAVHAFDAAAQQEILAFISQTSDWRVETFGADILIVDTNHSHYAGSNFGLETWVMADGSTISILGQAAHSAASALAA